MLDVSVLITRMNNQGVSVCVENGNLRVDSDTQLKNEQRIYLKQYKQKIIEHLLNGKIEAAEERAAIMEYDGGVPRDEAEKHAIEKHLTPYFFKCTDGEAVFLTKCETIEEAKEALDYQFRDKLIETIPSRHVSVESRDVE